MEGLASIDEMTELAGLAENQKRSSLIVVFSMEAQENEQKSKKAGRPVFDDVEVVEIRIPGDKDVIRKIADERDRQEYPKQYLAFRKSQTQETVSGFPLSQWAQMKKSQVEEARFFGIHTIEQLASVSDTNLQRLGPGWTPLRQLARDWDKAAQDGAATVKLRTDLEAMTARVKTLETMLQKQAVELHREGAPGVEVPADDRVARLEAMVERMAQGQAQPAPAVEAPKKVDGRSKEARAARAAAKAAEAKG